MCHCPSIEEKLRKKDQKQGKATELEGSKIHFNIYKKNLSLLAILPLRYSIKYCRPAVGSRLKLRSYHASMTPFNSQMFITSLALDNLETQSISTLRLSIFRFMNTCVWTLWSPEL